MSACAALLLCGCVVPMEPAPMPLQDAPQHISAVAASPSRMTFMAADVPAPPPSVTLRWDASPDQTAVQYNLYQGPSSGVYTNIVYAGGDLTASAPVEGGGTYYFVATASTVEGVESLPSNEVIHTVPDEPTLTNVVITITASVTLTNPPGSNFYTLSASETPDGPWLPFAGVSISKTNY